MNHKKETPYLTFLIILVPILVFFYILSGIFNYEGLSINTFEEALLYAIQHPFQAMNEKTPTMLVLGVVIWIMLISYYMYYFRNFHSDPYGSADWLDVDEANRQLSDENEKNNRIVSQNLKISLEGGLPNNNMLIIASSGDYKTTGIVEQNLLQFASSYIMLDVKGDTQRKLGNAFLEAGYQVKSLNFKNPAKSDRYNPFVYIETEEDILRIVKAFVEACRTPEKEAGDPFWPDAVKFYSQCLFERAWLKKRETGRIGTMNDVVEATRMESTKMIDPHNEENVITALENEMNILAEKYGAEYPPVRDYRKLKEGAPETVRSVTMMINTMLAICETAEVKRIFEDNDIDIREIGLGVGNDPEKRTVLFLVTPDQNPVYNWIVSMFYTQAIDILIRCSDDEINGPLPCRVEFWLDEFYAGAKPADAVELLGTIRSRNICMIPVLQSYSQIKSLYRDDKWEIIMDNTSVVVYYGSGPLAQSTHEFISKALGNQTIDTRTDNQHFGRNGNSGINYQQKERALLTPDEVRKIPTTDAIIFIKARNPVYDTKSIPFDQPKLGYKAPSWLKNRYSKALSLGKYEHPVYTVYDPIHFHYVTIRKEKELQVVTDEKDIATLQYNAKTNSNIEVFNIDENELLYLSWGMPADESKVEQVYRRALEKEQKKAEELKGLLVLQDLSDVPDFGTKRVDKSGWNHQLTFKQLFDEYFDQLPIEEQEEVLFAIDEGFSESQLKKIFFADLEDMSTWRRTFILERKYDDID